MIPEKGTRPKTEANQKGKSAFCFYRSFKAFNFECQDFAIDALFFFSQNKLFCLSKYSSIWDAID